MWGRLIEHVHGGQTEKWLASYSYSVSSVIRGHHLYKVIWTPFIGEQLLLEAENGNLEDRYAVQQS